MLFAARGTNSRVSFRICQFVISLEFMKQPHINQTPLRFCLLACLAVFSSGNDASAADNWMTWASTYTHAPETGQRVDQYASPAVAYGPAPDAVQRSGYRNFRSTIQAGQSADNYHRVDEWGAKVQPYEQWRFPYRPYGVPYPAWGPQAPYGIFNGSGLGYGGFFPGVGLPPGVAPGTIPAAGTTPAPGTPGTGLPATGRPGFFFPPNPIPGFPLQPQYNNQPWFDGSYPQAPELRNLRPGFRERLQLRRPPATGTTP